MPDLLNAVFASVLVLFLFHINKTPLRYYPFILGHLALIFFLNDFLFPIEYMPDQFKYIDAATLIRDNLDFISYRQYGYSTNVLNASLIFSIFPIPFLNSVFSIAIINFLLYSFIFVFLYKKRILTGAGIYFYLLFPSFALYTGLALRDTLVLFIMIMSVYQLYRGRVWASIAISSLLFFVKSQNFIIFLLSLLLHKIHEMYGLKGFILFVFLLVSASFNLNIIELLNYYRTNMFISNGGNMESYIPLSNSMHFFIQAITGFINTILKPFVWESKGNLFILIQSFENMFITSIILYLLHKLASCKDKFANFLIYYFVIGMVVYGVVVFNVGTVSRYKYTFILIFVIFAIKLLSNKRVSTMRRYEEN